MTATTLSPREMKRRRKQGADYVPPSPYTVKAALTHGDVFTKLSAVVFGLGNIVRKQYVKGIAMLALEVAFFVFMATNGVGYLSKLPSLGENKGGKKLVDGFWQYVEPDRSVVILLYGVASLVICVAFVGLWVMSVRSAYKSQVLLEENGKAPSFMDDVHELLDAKAHVLLMFLPTLGIAVFTVLPLIFMISMAFTSYDHKHLVLFHWVGFENFAKVFSNSGGTVNAALFGRVLVWTLVWAFFATFLNFFFGMFVAMIINRKTTHFKGFWRACFSMSIAVPQFVSLLVMHTMLQPQGAVNRMLQTWGWIDGPLPFFTNATWARYPAEHSCRSIRSGEDRWRKLVADLHQDHHAVHHLRAHTVPDHHLHRQCEQLQRHLPAVQRRSYPTGRFRRLHRSAHHLAVQAHRG